MTRSRCSLVLFNLGFLLIFSILSHCSKDLIVFPDNPSFVPSNILLVSTLNGSLHAVDRNGGRLLWTVNDFPRIRVSSAQIGGQFFVTDPTNGELYVIDGQRTITKFPKSIPELVSESPQKTPDGILTTGKKTSSWIAVDPKTGSSYDYQPESLTTCPIPSEATIFIPRTEYVLSLLDSTRQSLWNATFYRYGPQMAPKHQNQPQGIPDMVFTAAASGELLKLSADRETVAWYHKYQSPVVGVFSLGADGALKEMSHHVVESAVMKRFIQSANVPGSFKKLLPEVLQNVHRSVEQMLFVGQHAMSAYALPTILEKRNGELKETFLPLVEFIDVGSGQQDVSPAPQIKREDEKNASGSELEVQEKRDVALTTAVIQSTILQCVPPVLDSEPSNLQQPGDISSFQLHLMASMKGYHPMPQTAFVNSFSNLEKPLIEQSNTNSVYTFISGINNPLAGLGISSSGVIISLIGLVTFGGLIFWTVDKRLAAIEKSVGSSKKSDSNHVRSEHLVASETAFVVGKIQYDPTQLLGRGCDGTCVFRGQFDGRPVAVKRLLPDCFSFADREVALLRESDFHHNVIRYFCTEADSQFRYIALELCQANLTTYVEKRAEIYSDLVARDLLLQAIRGLSHLHKLNIVHRDIKPHNVLLSYPDTHGHVRILISDFGLCKKLSHERMSFSKVSGMLGTQGWIAPEMMDGRGNPTRAIDIFSAGCMFYYCITGGHHPFGDNGFSRQANIVDDHREMKYLSDDLHDDIIARHLISCMIDGRPEKRPSAESVMRHPFFWNHARQLAFLQDVSDRVEKEEINSEIVDRLEDKAGAIVRWNWRTHIGEELQEDLRKFRNYRGGSVRDLLRALRNKKHHYRELPDSVRISLGDIPVGFVDYFTSRFPRLLLHIYLAVQICKEETQFSEYYSPEMDWPPMEHAVDKPWRRVEKTDSEDVIIRRNAPSPTPSPEDIKAL